MPLTLFSPVWALLDFFAFGAIIFHEKVMNMENGDQVFKRGCLCPQDSGGGVSNPNNASYLRHCLAPLVFFLPSTL